MLRRPPTRIPLKTDDIDEYEDVSYVVYVVHFSIGIGIGTQYLHK